MTIVLAIVLGFNTGVEAAQNVATIVRVAKVVHHHFTRPIGHAVKSTAKKISQ